MNQVYLGLGTNLGDKENNLLLAIEKIKHDLGEIEKVSSFYESEPWGFESDSHFVNAVVKVITLLNPFEVLVKIQEIEHQMGRIKSKKGYEDRLIDIDILYYNDEIIESETLTIPHPHIKKRDFVLNPLLEIDSNLVCPKFKLPLKSII